MEFFDGDYICHHCSVKTQLAIAEIQCLLGEIGLSDEGAGEYHQAFILLSSSIILRRGHFPGTTSEGVYLYTKLSHLVFQSVMTVNLLCACMNPGAECFLPTHPRTLTPGLFISTKNFPTNHGNTTVEGLTLGRIVYHVIDEGVYRPAIICHVENKEIGIVNLFTFCDVKNDGEGLKYTNDVYYSELQPICLLAFLVSSWN